MFTLLLIWCSDIYSVTINTCADPGSLSNFDNVFFVDEGREDPNRTMTAPSSARQQNAI